MKSEILILAARGQTTRRELAEVLEYSKTAIGEDVRTLINAGVLREDDSQRRRHSEPIPLVLNVSLEVALETLKTRDRRYTCTPSWRNRNEVETVKETITYMKVERERTIYRCKNCGQKVKSRNDFCPACVINIPFETRRAIRHRTV